MPTLDNITISIDNFTDIGDIRLPPASKVTIISLSALFFVIGSVGFVGNALVIFVVLSDKRMRSSVTNIFIMNLAVSDFIIMVVCVPDIVQFMENVGWRLGLNSCRLLRFTEVFALYASVMTLVGVCVERYIAIIHPIKAHIYCCRRRILVAIGCIWPLAMVCASPNLFLHKLQMIEPGFTPCLMLFPRPLFLLLFKYSEFVMFYLLPLLVQIILYIKIGKQLFGEASFRAIEPAIGKEVYAETMRARRGVVKMLIAGVGVYFLSFSPHQVLLFYNTFSETHFQETWSYLIFVNTMIYVSSACNPLLYSIFSQKFRQKFRSTLCCRAPVAKNINHITTAFLGRRNRNITKSVKTTVTEV
ncbi:neuropeptide receptor 15-like [Limulus polyphemus]|uniref:Neuropeptide receptor 15-like n=1 Tax=Limulus polyphemus TaxID=6850 RepID=A0ABM1B600_LIMPO|nr:neuropeptide receptor 15-like [Limulus polyphemus]